MDGVSNAYDLYENGPKDRTLKERYTGETGFKTEYMDTDANELAKHSNADQTHHFEAFFSAGINGGVLNRISLSYHNWGDNTGDQNLANAGYDLGAQLQEDPKKLRNVGAMIRKNICNRANRGKHL